MLSSLPKTEWRLADKGHDATWFRKARHDKPSKPCLPGRSCRNKPVTHDKCRHKRRHCIENRFGRRKNWRRVAMRHNRRPRLFPSAIALAATVMSWLRVLSVGRHGSQRRRGPVVLTNASARLNSAFEPLIAKCALLAFGLIRSAKLAT